MNTAQFIQAVGPAAKASMQQTGLSAAFVIAEAALESAWGGSELAQRGKNLFGVKVYPGWEGATLSIPTREYLEGQWQMVPAQWCLYLSWEDSILDHARFLFAMPRYAEALRVRNQPAAFAQAVQEAGYATDPLYAKKIISIVNAHSLDAWDVPQTQWALVEWANVQVA